MKAILLDARSPKAQVVNVNADKFQKMAANMLRRQWEQLATFSATLTVDGTPIPVWVHFIDGSALRKGSRDMSRHALRITNSRHYYGEGPIVGSVLITGRHDYELDYVDSMSNIGIPYGTLNTLIGQFRTYTTPRRGTFGRMDVDDINLFHSAGHYVF